MAARSKAWVCGRSLPGIVGSNSAGVWMSLVSAVCCQVEVSASGWSLVQRIPTDCDVSECNHKSSTMRRPWPPRGVVPWKTKRHYGIVSPTLTQRKLNGQCLGLQFEVMMSHWNKYLKLICCLYHSDFSTFRQALTV